MKSLLILTLVIIGILLFIAFISWVIRKIYYKIRTRNMSRDEIYKYDQHHRR